MNYELRIKLRAKCPLEMQLKDGLSLLFFSKHLSSVFQLASGAYFSLKKTLSERHFQRGYERVIIVGCLMLIATFLSQSASAQTMKNDSYIIQMGNLNELSGKSTGSGYNLNQTAGEVGAGLYSGTNYKARAGFQYISGVIKFRFTISNTSIDFGSLTPTNPVTRTNNLTVSNQSAGGYSVKAYENHELMVPTTGAVIPDTTCDSGTCSETKAAAWTSTLTYGFGYRCDKVDSSNFCNSEFSTKDYYKQFTNISKNEKAQTVMKGATGRNQRSKITYKVNISGAQYAGLYSNAITYIATPTY